MSDNGLSIIGCGFNVYADDAPKFDSATNTALRNRVFIVDNSTAKRIDALGGVTERVFALETTSKIQSHFSQQVGIKVRYGAFKGSAEVSYQTQSNRKYSYMCFLRENINEHYGLRINDEDSKINDSFKEHVKNLPDKFDYKGNKAEFIEFFKKWGTHVITAVGMGSRSRLSRVISRQTSMNTQKVKEFVEGEYLWISGESSGGFDQSVYNDFFEKEKIFTAIGGDPIKAGQAGTSPEMYKKWYESTSENPKLVNMRLIAISNINIVKTMKKNVAIEEALDYFDLRMSALPVYYLQCPEAQDQEEDNLFWTFEDGAPLPNNYQNKGIVFYVLPCQKTAIQPLVNVQVFTKPGGPKNNPNPNLRPFAYNVWEPIPNSEHPEFFPGWERNFNKDLTILYRDINNPVKIYEDSIELNCYDKSVSNISPSSLLCYLSIYTPPDNTRYTKRNYPYGYVFAEESKDTFSLG